MSTEKQSSRQPSPHRRTVLRAAVAAPAAGAVGVGVGTDTASAAAHGGRFDADSPRFALAVLPDTQYLFDADSADPAPLRATFRHLVTERSADNIAFMTHLGDVTEHGTEDEIELAADTFRVLHGRVPYSVLAGNHDIESSTDDQRGRSAYLSAFGPHRYRSMPTFGGASPDGYNSYHVLRAGGRRWLVLALDWRISDKGMAWAQRVLDTHPTLPTVLTTHDLAASGEDGEARLSGHWSEQVSASGKGRRSGSQPTTSTSRRKSYTSGGRSRWCGRNCASRSTRVAESGTCRCRPASPGPSGSTCSSSHRCRSRCPGTTRLRPRRGGGQAPAAKDLQPPGDGT